MSASTHRRLQVALLKTTKDVFMRPGYIFLSQVLFFIFFVLVISLHNLDFIFFLLFSEAFSLGDRFFLFFTTFETFWRQNTVTTYTLSLILVFLMSVNVTFLVYYIRRKASLGTSSKTGVLGLIVGIFGIGCSACGSILLTSVIGLSASTTLLAYFPLKGMEFLLIGILVVVISTLLLIYQIHYPATCQIKPPKAKVL